VDRRAKHAECSGTHGSSRIARPARRARSQRRVREVLHIQQPDMGGHKPRGGANLSGFNNDLSLTIIDVGWTDVYKPAFFSGSYSDLTDTPSVEDLTNPQGPQGELGLNCASEWSDISNKPTWVTTRRGASTCRGSTTTCPWRSATWRRRTCRTNTPSLAARTTT
jgi:hypothetical protein